MKKVLIVTYSFPPAENACARRADSFVGQITKYGWEPLVIASEIKSKAAVGTQEPANAPAAEGIDIVRTGSWQSENLPAPFRSAADFFASLLIPDTQRLWELFCIRKAIRLARSEGVDLIYTLSPPSSAHLIGMRLKKKYPGIPWVADFCESDEPAGRRLKKAREQYIKKLTSSVLHEADCIITGSTDISSSLTTNIENPEQTEICSIPDGHVQELTEQFEKACRTIAARKLNKNSNE